MKKKFRNQWIIIFLLVGILFLFFIYPSNNSLTLHLQNVGELSQGHYETWAVFGKDKISLGKFTKGNNFIFDSDVNLNRADEIMISVEPEGDHDNIPSGIVYLSGSMQKKQVELKFPINLEDHFPALESGWRYEGWGQNPDTNLISVGKSKSFEDILSRLDTNKSIITLEPFVDRADPTGIKPFNIVLYPNKTNIPFGTAILS